MRCAKTLQIFLAVAGLLLTGPAFASTLFDVNDDDAGSPTLTGWTAVDATGINNVTFTAVGGESVTIDDRDRAANNGGEAEADMWRDFIFANGSFTEDTGLDITVSGLLANTTYYVALWAYDTSSSPTRTATWTGSNGGTSGILSFNGADPTPMTLNDNRLEITAVTDGSGILTLEGRAGPSPSTSHNVFINGLELDDEPLFIAEPKLFIDRTTGNMTFTNDSFSPIRTLGYTMTSANGAFNGSQWKSIAANYDSDSGDSSVDSDDTWIELSNPADHTDLSEFELGGAGPNDGALIASGQSIDFGAGVWIRNPLEDITMTLKLDDGTNKTVFVQYVGNNDEPFLAGDFDFDMDIDEDDYLTLLAGLHTDLSAFSGAEAYPMGDMNGDSANNFADTVLFRAAYDDFNGPGAFAAMVAGVPEPTGFALFGLTGIAVLYFRRRNSRAGYTITAAGNRSLSKCHRIFLGLLFLSGLVLVCAATNASADPLFFDANDDDAVSPTQAGWTAVDATGINNVTFTAVGENAEGASVTVDDRNRTNNDGGAEPDMWSDFIFANGSNTNGSGLDITVSNLLANTTYYVAIWAYDNDSNSPRNSTWTGSNGGTSTFFMFDGSLDPPYDLGDWRLDLSAVTDNSGVLTIEGRAGPDPHEHHNVFVNGIEISDEPLPPTTLTLEINTDTGATRILNETGYEIATNYYEITSSSGSLDPDGWYSLDEQNFDAIGTNVGESWDAAGGSDEGILSEIFFHGNTTLLDQDVVNLGSAFDRVAGQEDIQFSYGRMNGTLKAGFVSYVTGGTVDDADFDGDGDVDGADFVAWQMGFGRTSGASFADGDGNGDGAVDAADLAIWQSQFGTGGTAAGGVTGTAVPEPSTLGIFGLVCAGLGLGFLRRRKGGQIMRATKLSLVLGVSVLLALAQTALADYTLDRDYRLGDDDFASANDPVYSTYDTAGVSLDNLDAFAVGAGDYPTYVNTSDRMNAEPGELGIQLDASQEHYLEAVRLGSPQTSAYGTSLEDYAGIVNRGFQLWIKPATVMSGVRQDIVMDTLQHGVGITDTGNWFMQYNGAAIDSGVAVTANQWYHVMVVRPYGPSGPGNGAQMYVDGVAVAAQTGGYNGDDDFMMTIGVSSHEVLPEEPYNFFSGIVDDLEVFVLGTSTSDPPTVYGTFNLGTDNEYIASTLTGVAGDVNQDGVLDGTDVDAFIAGWKSANLVNEIPVGDLHSITRGDLDFSGVTDLDDAFLLHEALLVGGLGGFDFSRLSGVPEPATGWLVLVALITIGMMRRRSTQ